MNLDFVRGDMRSLPFEDQCFDRVLSWFTSFGYFDDGDFAIDRQQFDPASARALTERTIVRAGRTRQFSFSVRMFIAAELRDWLLAAGFSSVEFFDHAGEPLSAQSPRMVTIATH